MTLIFLITLSYFNPVEFIEITKIFDATLLRKSIFLFSSTTKTPSAIELKTVFNRGFSSGFYMGRTTDEWASGENNLATETKKLLGQIEHFYQKINVAEIKLNKDDRVNNGDEYIIIGPSTGVLRDKFFEIKMEKEILTFKTKQKVRKNDKLFLVTKNEN